MIIFQLLKGFFRSWRKFTFPIIFCLNLQHFEKLNHKKSVTFYFLQYFTLCHSTHSGLVIVVQSNSKNCHLTPDECDHCAPLARWWVYVDQAISSVTTKIFTQKRDSIYTLKHKHDTFKTLYLTTIYLRSQWVIYSFWTWQKVLLIKDQKLEN